MGDDDDKTLRTLIGVARGRRRIVRDLYCPVCLRNGRHGVEVPLKGGALICYWRHEFRTLAELTTKEAT